MEERRRRAKKIEVPEKNSLERTALENTASKRSVSDRDHLDRRKKVKKKRTADGRKSGRKPSASRPETAAKRRTASSKKRRKRRSGNIFGRIIQVLLVIALVCVLFFVVRNFGEGNKLNNKGLDAYAQADYETANAYFAKAIEYDGGNGEYYMNQGMAQSELKLYDDAMASFNKALELMKRDKDIQLVHRAMGISLLYQGNYDEALEAFDKALDGKESRFSGTEIDVLYYKAETQDKAGRYVDAVMTYSQIVDAENSADAYLLRGMEYVKVGDGTSRRPICGRRLKKIKRIMKYIWHSMRL